MRQRFANQIENSDEDNILVFQIEISPDEARIKEIPTKIGYEFNREFKNLDKLRAPTLPLKVVPEKNGIELCFELKNNPSTFLIPVILLTTMDSGTSCIKRFENEPDATLDKPYNEKVLISTIYNLVQSRRKLKNEHGEVSFPLGDLNTKKKHDEDFIDNCLGEIYKGIASSNFNLIHLSQRIGMSRSSFYRKIKEVTGLRPVDFVRKAKLQYAAKRLLINSDMRVCEIAWESGFSDIKYFSKLFFKEFGKLPSKFKGKSSPNPVFI